MTSSMDVMPRCSLPRHRIPTRPSIPSPPPLSPQPPSPPHHLDRRRLCRRPPPATTAITASTAAPSAEALASTDCPHHLLRCRQFPRHRTSNDNHSSCRPKSHTIHLVVALSDVINASNSQRMAVSVPSLDSCPPLPEVTASLSWAARPMLALSPEDSISSSRLRASILPCGESAQ
mmetsp:Transcript_12523/g.36172  ORF Transcript_12523/g.36172 Transcript_12523/m.36172 type:complete len:176 (+) Transcript_12523:370-897(+)